MFTVGLLVSEERTNGGTDRRTNGQVDNIMPRLSL